MCYHRYCCWFCVYAAAWGIVLGGGPSCVCFCYVWWMCSIFFGQNCMHFQSVHFFLPTEEGPIGFVQEAKQHLFSRGELYSQPYKGRINLDHLQQHGCAAKTVWNQGSRPQKDLQQRKQDWQDVQDSVPGVVWDFQPGVLGHISQPGTGDQRSSVNSALWVVHPPDSRFRMSWLKCSPNQCQALIPCVKDVLFLRSLNNTACLLLQENVAMLALSLYIYGQILSFISF